MKYMGCMGSGSLPEARADTAAAPSLFDTLDRITPSSMPTGVAVAKKPITVQNFRMLACAADFYT